MEEIGSTIGSDGEDSFSRKAGFYPSAEKTFVMGLTRYISVFVLLCQNVEKADGSAKGSHGSSQKKPFLS